MLKHFLEFLKRLCGAKPAPKPERKLVASNVGQPHPRSPKVTTERAAQILGVSYDCLRTRRQRGTGPRYFKQGRFVRYYLCDLLNYKAQQELKACGGRV